MATKRFLYVNEGPNLDNLCDFIDKSMEQLEGNNYKNIIIYSPTKNSFLDGITSNAFSKEFIKALDKKGSYTIKDITFHLKTSKTINSTHSADMIIAIYVGENDLDKIENIRICQSVSYISWLTEEAKRWDKIWSPTILGGAPIHTSPLELPKDVTDELERLTRRINLSTGLEHPLDKKAATEAFERLKSQKIIVTHGDIKSWAMQNNWSARHAEQLEKMAERYIQ
ncbi:hypothetical protein PE074_06470 [Wohlfahrtiimonas chitiniclastica]|uniref:hypothetical protein n=1 Tax=Wohlfahrtiimonas chitiniclastica TaxID=400946 RepID=UPI0007B40F1A|nr:hypothetical protein [Wohlfahrtiimonas chitiniclastica]KZS22222.1 hypothetical protein BMY_0038 [Wohlfahrtiimonas chitiniclastica]WHR54739.1 hypothetical protein PE074_06470 [Wohlfahrtiimonas chitiniclastica]